MTTAGIVLSAVLGVLAAGAGWLAWLQSRARQAASTRLTEVEAEARADRARLDEARIELDATRSAREASAKSVLELSERLSAAHARLEAAESARQEIAAHQKQATEQLKASFRNLAGETMTGARDELLKQAKAYFDERRRDVERGDVERAEAVRRMTSPIAEMLNQTRERLGTLDERLRATAQQGGELRAETARLARALSRPEVRGRYGEIQLRRVAELAGMTAYCDFDEQRTTTDTDGNALRPDMVVRLPNERVVAVDAKTNTYAYLEAVNAATDEERRHHLARFGRHFADQVRGLSKKQYWAQFDGSLDLVVMFVPGDHFLDAALAQEPGLIETAAQEGVILATPSTLIGLLRAVAVGWREERLAEEAHALLELGRELHERSANAYKAIEDLGRSIRQSVDRFNKLAGSVDKRLTPTLRKFEQAGVKSGKPLVEPTSIDEIPRLLESTPGDDASRA